MRILVICRLFSGIEKSVIEGKWSPSGAPAIYKLINGLDSGDDDLHLVLTVKDSDKHNISRWGEARDREVTIDGLKVSPLVLAGVQAFPGWLGKARMLLRDFRQTWRMWREIKRFSPDLVYVDNANVFAAAILSRFTSAKVVLRLMGVYPFMRNCRSGYSLRNIYHRFCYSSPFYFSLCGIDGSGGENFMSVSLRHDVPKLMLLNGTEGVGEDMPYGGKLDGVPENKFVVLFVGKLERFKGGMTFVEAIFDAERRCPGVFHGLMIGSGNELDDIRQRIVDADAQGMFTLIERLPHDQIFAAHNSSNAYVSLNHYGNMSNANLEAIAAKQCVVIPASQPDVWVDLITDKLIPENAVCRLADINDAQGLADILVNLYEEPDKTKDLQKSAAELADSLLWGWRERIEWEIDLLRKLSRAEKIDNSDRDKSQVIWLN